MCGGERESKDVLYTIDSRTGLVARKRRGDMRRGLECIEFKREESSGPEADFAHVDVQNRGPDG